MENVYGFLKDWKIVSDITSTFIMLIILFKKAFSLSNHLERLGYRVSTLCFSDPHMERKFFNSSSSLIYPAPPLSCYIAAPFHALMLTPPWPKPKYLHDPLLLNFTYSFQKFPLYLELYLCY